MKKLLFVVSTLNTGGAQKVLSNLVMNIPEGYQIDILLNSTENIVYPYKGKLINLGFKSQANMTDIFYQMKVFFKRVYVLHKMKATREYIATISFLDSANIANIISGKKWCRTILSVHNNLTESATLWVYKYLVNPMVRLLYGRADKIIAVSKGIEFDLIHNLRLSKKNIETIYNGHDIKAIKEMSKQPVSENFERCFKGYPIITTMGRLDYQKGQWHLIRSLIKVKEIFPEVKLLLVGEGELRAYLQKLVHECGLDDNVIFCGFVKNPFAIIAKGNIFVLPSMFEGFPNALIEALCCELPCIATDFSSGAREILMPKISIDESINAGVYEAEFGILTPVCDGIKYTGKDPLTKEEIYLADSILKMLGDQNLLKIYRERANQAVQGLSAKQMVKKWLEVIEGTVG